MPTIQLPIKYKSPYGIGNVLTPPDDDTLPGFDPNFAQAQNLDTASNASPAPSDIPPPPSSAAAAMDSTGVKLPSLTPGSSIRKFKAPTMPPPEQVGSMDQQPATDTASNPVQAAPPADPTAPAAQPSATDKLDQLHAQRPPAPTSNLMQRLGLAALSMTKMAPIANQIMHPKWAAQQSAYENTLEDTEAQQKEEQTAAWTEMQKQHGQYWEQRGEQERNRFKLDPKSGTMYDTQTGTVTQAPKSLTDRITEYTNAGYSDVDAHRLAVGEKPDQTFEVNEDAGKRIGLAPDANGKYRIPGAAVGSIYRTDNPVQKSQVTPEMRAAATAVGADPNSPDDWTPQQADDILNRVKPPREQREPSPTQQRYQEQQTIRQLTNRVISDAKVGGSPDDSLYDDAMRNVRDFYQNDPDIDAYREDVISRIQSLKRGGLNTDVVQNRASSAAGKTDWMKRLQGGAANQPAQPPSAAFRLGQQIAKSVKGQAASGQAKPPIMQANSLQEVIRKAPPGRHLLRNGSTLEKRPDGRVLLDGKVIQ